MNNDNDSVKRFLEEDCFTKLPETPRLSSLGMNGFRKKELEIRPLTLLHPMLPGRNRPTLRNRMWWDWMSLDRVKSFSSVRHKMNEKFENGYT